MTENDKFRIIYKLVENQDGERRQDVIPAEVRYHSCGSRNPFLQNRDVIPAEAGIQRKKRKYLPIDWIPASAGMTKRQE